MRAMALDFSALFSMQAITPDPTTMARQLSAFWLARWGACEHLDDVTVAPETLTPWADHLMTLNLVDYGTDFRIESFGRSLAPLVGPDRPGSLLSNLPAPMRQDLRRIVLQASMLLEPIEERHDWLVDGHVWSGTACAMPIAGSIFQPTRFLLGLFFRTPEWRPKIIPIHACIAPVPRAITASGRDYVFRRPQRF